jgi:hypothetical protein
VAGKPFARGQVGSGRISWLAGSGRGWRHAHSLATPSPAGRTDFSLSGVSCTSANFCLAAYKVTALWEGTAGQ